VEESVTPSTEDTEAVTMKNFHGEQCRTCVRMRTIMGDIPLRLMTWTNNFSKTFLIFASLIPFFRLIIPEKCFYQ